MTSTREASATTEGGVASASAPASASALAVGVARGRAVEIASRILESAPNDRRSHILELFHGLGQGKILRTDLFEVLVDLLGDTV